MDLSKKKCVPCEAGGKALSKKGVAVFSKDFPKWTVKGNKKIIRKFKFEDFKESIEFVNKVAKIAKTEDHHPDIYISYDIVTIELTTHKVKGLTENDFIIAAKVDKILADRA
ncbi:MAG TPA: 4a-hydroxytetrahydrobiopterin dehydratase [Candidatus Paceibacterota bacterium]